VFIILVVLKTFVVILVLGFSLITAKVESVWSVIFYLFIQIKQIRKIGIE
jgi:hypothetical protein